jgi:spheroidene monooxygenase
MCQDKLTQESLASVTQTVSLSFYRFPDLRSRLWMLAQMGLARGAMARTEDIGFWKLCGSGTGEGFTPVALPRVFAILATWPDLQTARARVATGPVFARWRGRAAESWSVFLAPTSARGSWSGVAPFATVAEPQSGPLAALTRATVKPSVALRFWGRVPDISARIGEDRDVLFKIGIGEVPLLHQVTFSIWPSARSMAEFARTGPHAAAVKAVHDEGWFREELYARFAVVAESGSWNGTSPLEQLEAA